MSKITLDRFKLTEGHSGEIELRWLDDDGAWFHVAEVSQQGILVRNIRLDFAEGHPFVIAEGSFGRIATGSE